MGLLYDLLLDVRIWYFSNFLFQPILFPSKTIIYPSNRHSINDFTIPCYDLTIFVISPFNKLDWIAFGIATDYLGLKYGSIK